MSFPRARGLDDANHVILAAEHVVFIQDTMEYHTIPDDCFRLWQLCNGRRSERALAEAVYGGIGALELSRVRLALSKLAKANLIEDETVDRSLLDRRTVMKLASAVVAGGFTIPAIVSITVPTSASAHSHVPATLPNTATCPTDGSEVCHSGCCCTSGGTYGACVDSCPPGDYWCANNPPTGGNAFG